MSYLFLLRHEVDRSSLAEVLAEMLSLPVTAIDVGDDGVNERNWAAPISCTVSHLDGDLPLHLDIYFNDSVAAPSDADAAAWLAARLNTVVAYKSVPLPPSAYWLVGPDGQRTRARLLDEDEKGNLLSSGRRIAATESVLPLLPDVPVAPLVEVIGEYRMPTPIADGLRRRLPTTEQTMVQPAIEVLANWEAAVARLVSGWPPDGWYPPDYYRDDMELRDKLGDAFEVLPISLRAEFVTALETIDSHFTVATVDDRGESLTAASGPVPDRWWWHRTTDPLPWHSMPRTADK
ncbi:hypothetical protein Q0Z83_061620 [Actinoplanes sichuanensis]|uniref:DUF4262 domain-containing protein n=1 Tax=Actinoplanes sichuanensis TaxID=512349 RepID=A0ABW3ZZR4_9ACTN|nr:hypothetical protein [Actinoplanes sichuanensis]BEL07971.1 hypothetical protein Q0Z83_061620 [Actinoplanes sichuanensis]